jgi:LPXTG-motif cell wall-anchored protein
VVKDAFGNWVIPTKPTVPTGQDADTSTTAVVLQANTPSAVRWVVTNTSTTWLTDLTLVNTLTSGTPVASDWTADLSPVGGPSAYNFATSGPWTGMLAPGESFFAEGTLTLPAGGTHANVATVTGRVIIPEVDLAGLPTGNASVDGLGVAQRASFANGDAFVVTASDPFNALVRAALAHAGTDSQAPLLAGFLLLLGGVGAILYVSRRRRQVG